MLVPSYVGVFSASLGLFRDVQNRLEFDVEVLHLVLQNRLESETRELISILFICI
jgi:hypothetical protein